MTTWDEGWHCSCCSNFKWSRYKACQQRSAKKAFAMGPKPMPFVQLPPWAPKPPGPPPVGFKGLVQHLPVPAAATTTATPAGVAAVGPTATTTPTTASRGALHNRTRCLEAALAALPPPTSFDDDCYKIPRNELVKQIAALKMQMIDAKPIGARIDGCRAALARAMKRRDSGHEALRAAQAVVTAADIGVATLAIDLQTFEIELQSSTETEPETDEFSSLSKPAARDPSVASKRTTSRSTRCSRPRISSTTSSAASSSSSPSPRPPTTLPLHKILLLHRAPGPLGPISSQGTSGCCSCCSCN